MTTEAKIQSALERTTDRLEILRREDAQRLERIERYAREARERGSARMAIDSLEYDIRQLAESAAEQRRLREEKRMLEYFLRDSE